MFFFFCQLKGEIHLTGTRSTKCCYNQIREIIGICTPMLSPTYMNRLSIMGIWDDQCKFEYSPRSCYFLFFFQLRTNSYGVWFQWFNWYIFYILPVYKVKYILSFIVYKIILSAVILSIPKVRRDFSKVTIGWKVCILSLIVFSTSGTLSHNSFIGFFVIDRQGLLYYRFT